MLGSRRKKGKKGEKSRTFVIGLLDCLNVPRELLVNLCERERRKSGIVSKNMKEQKDFVGKGKERAGGPEETEGHE